MIVILRQLQQEPLLRAATHSSLCRWRPRQNTMMSRLQEAKLVMNLVGTS